MRKISVLLLLVLALAGCAIFRITDVVIANNSDHIAFVSIWDFKKDGDHQGLESIEMQPHTSTSYKLYDNGRVELKRPNRNFLKKHSNKSYEILNMSPVIFTVYNKTNENNVILRDMNTLFDTQILTKDKDVQIQVYNPEKLNPMAFDSKGIVLQVKTRGRSMVVTY